MSHPAADDVIALYQDHAAAFEKQRRTHALIEQAWLAAFLDLMPAGGAVRVLDLGCGAGTPIARHLIEQGCQITGVDTSQPLLDIAQASFPDHRWIAADMRQFACPDTFQGVIAWHSFFHLAPDDQRPMFARFRRLAAPGAALMFTSGPAQGHAIGQFEGRSLYHGSLDPAEYRQLLADNGFDVVRHVANDPTCGGATIWLARQVDRHG
jgi:SAM-dependent methyltransferase